MRVTVLRYRILGLFAFFMTVLAGDCVSEILFDDGVYGKSELTMGALKALVVTFGFGIYLFLTKIEFASKTEQKTEVNVKA
jgi:hypothetical protein